MNIIPLLTLTILVLGTPIVIFLLLAVGAYIFTIVELVKDIQNEDL